MLHGTEWEEMPFALWKPQEKEDTVVQDLAGVLEVLKALLSCQMNSIFLEDCRLEGEWLAVAVMLAEQ